MFFNKKEKPRPIYPNIYSAVKIITDEFKSVYSRALFNKIPFFNFNEFELQKFTITEFVNYLKILEYITDNKFSYYTDGETFVLNFSNTEKNKFVQYIFENGNLIDKNTELKFIKNDITADNRILLPSPKPLRSKNKIFPFNIKFDPEIYFPRVEYRKYKSRKINFFTLELYLIFLEVNPKVLVNLDDISEINDLEKYFVKFKLGNNVMYFPRARLFIFDTYSDYPFVDIIPNREHIDVSEFRGSYFDAGKNVIWNIIDVGISNSDIVDASPLVELTFSAPTYIYRYGYKPFTNTLKPVFTELKKIW